MSIAASVGGGLISIAGEIQDKVEGIVSTIINFLRNIYNNVTVFFFNLFNWMAENPRAAIHFFATMYCLME